MTKQQLTERMQKVFAHLHANPESSWAETNTTAYLAAFLKEEGLVPNTFEDMTGLYVDIGQGVPKVGFRTDTDALWQEVDGEFKANHSCGHDGHTTMAIGVALPLNEQKNSLPGAGSTFNQMFGINPIIGSINNCNIIIKCKKYYESNCHHYALFNGRYFHYLNLLFIYDGYLFVRG